MNKYCCSYAMYAWPVPRFAVFHELRSLNMFCILSSVLFVFCMYVCPFRFDRAVLFDGNVAKETGGAFIATSGSVFSG